VRENEEVVDKGKRQRDEGEKWRMKGMDEKGKVRGKKPS
jgi:hypothetical protein